MEALLKKNIHYKRKPTIISNKYKKFKFDFKKELIQRLLLEIFTIFSCIFFFFFFFWIGGIECGFKFYVKPYVKKKKSKLVSED